MRSEFPITILTSKALARLGIDTDTVLKAGGIGRACGGGEMEADFTSGTTRRCLCFTACS